MVRTNEGDDALAEKKKHKHNRIPRKCLKCTLGAQTIDRL